MTYEMIGTKEKRSAVVRTTVGFPYSCRGSTGQRRCDGIASGPGRLEHAVCGAKNNLGGYLESVVRPATEFQHARLLVEREKFHVDLARRFEYGRRFPFYQPYVVYGRLGGQRHVEIPVGAADHTQTHIVLRPPFACMYVDTVCGVHVARVRSFVRSDRSRTHHHRPRYVVRTLTFRTVSNGVTFSSR